MKLVLIRHSEPDPERDAVDPPLTETGRELASATGQWLAGEGIATVYSSSTRRGENGQSTTTPKELTRSKTTCSATPSRESPKRTPQGCSR